jgi:hypothetical protein
LTWPIYAIALILDFASFALGRLDRWRRLAAIAPLPTLGRKVAGESGF